MHKQRLPFTAGGQGGAFGPSGFNFNPAAYGDAGGLAADGLNGMPFLGQGMPKPALRSQRLLADEVGREMVSPSSPAMTMAQRVMGGGLGRGSPGSGGGMPRPSAANSYGPYEGDASMLSMLDDSGKVPNEPLMHFGPTMAHNIGISAAQREAAVAAGLQDPLADTGSESDFCIQDNAAESRWKRGFDCFMSALPNRQRQSLQSGLKRCSDNVLVTNVLLVLQLTAWLIFAGIKMLVYFCGMNIPFRRGLVRTKFQVRSTMRYFLWRLANAKGNDTVVFLIVALAAPWLFLLSLVGFGVSFLFSLRTGLKEAAQRLRHRFM
ncbi:hypothetical protein KR018_003945 [Drosophila ironensis]|nr:hypothetical protein KR018_003945 [Drosophila ironensis]